MKIFIEYEKVIQVAENVRLILLNSEEFIERIKESSKNIPAVHIKVGLKYKLICYNQEYEGQSVFDSYKGISSEIDNNCPYNVTLKNWKLSDEIEKYFDFDITKK